MRNAKEALPQEWTRNLRGDLEIKYIVGLVLAIIVVYVIIVFFMGGVNGLGLKFGTLTNKSTEPLNTYNLSKILVTD